MSVKSLWVKTQQRITNFIKIVLLKDYVDQILAFNESRILMVLRKYIKNLPTHVVDSEVDDLHTIAQLEFLETIKVWVPYEHPEIWPLAQVRMLGAMKDHIRHITRTDPTRTYDWIVNAAHLYIGINTKADVYESFDQSDQLMRAMKTLTTREKKVVISYVYEDITFKAIGERINISESQVSRIYKTAIEKVKKEITTP
jgi:RNA polymerase sigma factor (sigma-70 family)